MARLKELLSKHGITQVELARLLGRDRAVITNLMHGRRTLKAEEAMIIAAYLKVPVTEILGGMASEERSVAEPQMIPFQHAPSAAARASRQVVKKKGSYYLDEDSALGRDLYALEVRDESMNLAGLLPGDIVLSSMAQPVKAGNIVIVQCYGERDAETLLRRYQPPLLLPHSTNPTFLPLDSASTEVRVVSAVIKLIRLYG